MVRDLSPVKINESESVDRKEVGAERFVGRSVAHLGGLVYLCEDPGNQNENSGQG